MKPQLSERGAQLRKGLVSGWISRAISGGLCATALLLAQSARAVPAVCVVSGTVLDGASQPVQNARVRIRTVLPTVANSAAYVGNDLTTKTNASGVWSLTLTQGLHATVWIDAASIANDITIPTGSGCPADFADLTLYARGTLTPVTILSDHGPSMGGDLTGASPSPAVVGFRGYPLNADTPATGKAWVYDETCSCYKLSTVGGANVNGLSSLTGTGLVARTDTSGIFAVRTLTAGTGITITNGDGVAANPTIAITPSAFPWTRTATDVALTTNTDTVTMGTVASLGKVTVSTDSVNQRAIVFKGISGQSANLAEWRNSFGQNMVTVGSENTQGAALVGTTTTHDINIVGVLGQVIAGCVPDGACIGVEGAAHGANTAILGQNISGSGVGVAAASTGTGSAARISGGSIPLIVEDGIGGNEALAVLPAGFQSLGAVGGVLNSGATVTPTRPIQHVAGTAAISTITVPTNLTTGVWHVIPDGAFTYTTGGNIGAAGTATVGRALDFVYDGTAWFPSY